MMPGKMMSARIRLMHAAFNQTFERERQYDRDTLSQSVRTKVSPLNQLQKTACDILMTTGHRRILSLDGPGKTGNTKNRILYV